MTPRTRRGEPVAVLGLGRAGGSLLASAAAARLVVVGKSARLRGLTRNGQWLVARPLFLAVPDDAIEGVAAELAALRAVPQLIVHMSGAKGAAALEALRASFASRQPIELGTFHPLASLDGKRPIPAGTFVAVDATSRTAERALFAIAKQMRLVPGVVREADRIRYHAGAVVAGNLATALLHEGVQLLVRSGVPADVARVSLARLLASTADNAIAHALPRALTGPVARGDVATVARHVALLAREDAGLADVYRALSRVLVDEVSAHDAAVKRRLRAALDGAGLSGARASAARTPRRGASRRTPSP